MWFWCLLSRFWSRYSLFNFLFLFLFTIWLFYKIWTLLNFWFTLRFSFRLFLSLGLCFWLLFQNTITNQLPPNIFDNFTFLNRFWIIIYVKIIFNFLLWWNISSQLRHWNKNEKFSLIFIQRTFFILIISHPDLVNMVLENLVLHLIWRKVLGLRDVIVGSWDAL